MVPASDPVKIKIYAQRRLYEPRTGSYVTVDHLLALVRRGARVEIEDAHAGADMTSFVFSETHTEH